MSTKKYVSLDKLELYDEKIKKYLGDADTTTLASAKQYVDDSVKLLDAAGSAATAKSEAIAAAQTYTDTQVNALANGAVKSNTDAISAIKDDANVDSFADVVAELAKKQDVGDYATKTEAQGYANAKDTAIAEAKAAGEAAQSTANANAQAIEAINNETTGILAQAKSFATTEDAKVQANVDALAGKVGTVPDGQTVMGIIENIQENAYDDTELSNRINTVSDKVDTLVGEDANKSVRTIANEELAKQLIAEGAAESLDTLAEIAAWIQSHPDDAAAMNAAIEALETKVDTGDKTVSAYVTDAIDALSIGDYAKAADLTALAGRVSSLETASATHATKTEVQAVSDSLAAYEDAHASDYTNAQIDAAIKVVADDVAALGDTYATDAELASAISGEVTRADGAYAAKSLETTVSNLSATVDTKAAQSEVNTISGKVSTLESDMSQAKTDIDAVEALAAANDAAIKALQSAVALKADATALTAVSDRVTTLETWHNNFTEVSEEEINNLFA